MACCIEKAHPPTFHSDEVTNLWEFVSKKTHPSSFIAFCMEKTHPPPVWYGKDPMTSPPGHVMFGGREKPRGIGGQRRRARAAAAAAAGIAGRARAMRKNKKIRLPVGVEKFFGEKHGKHFFRVEGTRRKFTGEWL